MKIFSFFLTVFFALGFISLIFVLPKSLEASYHFANFQGKPPIHIYGASGKKPVGITPAEIKKIYNLPQNGGHGTIALIGAYDDATIEADLADFDLQFGLPACTTKNGCFEKHKMTSGVKSNSGWALETTLDVEWAHAIAPSAKILLVEATTPSGANLLKAIDYAASRPDVVAVSMSWGGISGGNDNGFAFRFQVRRGLFRILRRQRRGSQLAGGFAKCRRRRWHHTFTFNKRRFSKRNGLVRLRRWCERLRKRADLSKKLQHFQSRRNARHSGCQLRRRSIHRLSDCSRWRVADGWWHLRRRSAMGGAVHSGHGRGRHEFLQRQILDASRAIFLRHQIRSKRRLRIFLHGAQSL